MSFLTKSLHQQLALAGQGVWAELVHEREIRHSQSTTTQIRLIATNKGTRIQIKIRTIETLYSSKFKGTSRNNISDMLTVYTFMYTSVAYNECDYQ